MSEPNQTPFDAATPRDVAERFENFRRRHHATLRPANVVEESLVEIIALENWRRQDPTLSEKARQTASRNFQRALKSLTQLRRSMGRGPLPPLPTLRPRKPLLPASTEATAKVIEIPLARQPANENLPDEVPLEANSQLRDEMAEAA
ncbi:MAG: hypothetical protein NZV14_00175 [Bryobacteraceae bacterium]|nr:hypothetical protein [Bryobacteraceae bacterium]MDW8376547.1 hypothetical protein [Bryobacterales bacterium]